MEATVTRESPAFNISLPTTIGEVISRLAAIIKECAATNDRAGYFAILYYKVTCRIQECLAENQFEDGVRMEQLDVIFANRYIEAYEAWKTGEHASASWLIAFETGKVNAPLVLQHLLLGMNAHINLDLGIATSIIMKDLRLNNIQKDFNTINRILGELTETVQKSLISVNPLLNLLQLHKYDTDEMLVGFSMDTARDGAWMFAHELHHKSGADYDHCLAIRDKSIAALGSYIAKPRNWLLQITIQIARIFERKKVTAFIKLLEHK
jgi:hypothetical protein